MAVLQDCKPYRSSLTQTRHQRRLAIQLASVSLTTKTYHIVNTSNNKQLSEALASLSKRTDISEILQSHKHLSLAIKSFNSALSLVYGDACQQEQEAFANVVSKAGEHIELWLGRLMYLHLCAETQ